MNLDQYIVRIHSNIADKSAAIKLWYYCRLCSSNGLAKINLNLVSKFFKVTKQTIRNWLKWCLDNNFIRSYRTDNRGNYSIFYSALTKVTEEIGIVTSIDLKENQNLKIKSTEAVTQHLQNVAKFAAKFNYQRIKKLENPFARTVKDIKNLFDLSPSELKAIGVLGRTKRYLLIDHNFSHYGISYESISKSLCRHTSTIKRRLKDTLKVQIAQQKNIYYAEYQLALEEFQHNRYIFCNINNKPQIFKALTNVYYPTLELNSMRYRKQQLKKSIDL